MARIAVVTLVGVSLVAAGCAVPTVERRQSACELAQANRASIARVSGRDLLDLAYATPAESDARSAWAQQISTVALGATGGAALLVGLIDGFATDPATQTGARNAAYGLGGGALASFAVAWLLSYTFRAPRERARVKLLDWSNHCP